MRLAQHLAFTILMIIKWMNSIDDMPLFIYTTNLNLRKEIETLEEPLLAA